MIRKLTKGLLIVAFLFLCLQWKKEYRRYREGYSSYRPIEEGLVKDLKRFVIVIPSFCNEKYVERNLRSVFEQDYPNYRVIYIDDFSKDATLRKAKEVVSSWGMDEKVVFIRNPYNIGQLGNYYYTIESCDNDEIIVTLDGDDWFAHDKVLSQLNRYYNDENVWMTYGQMVTYPDFKKFNGKEPLFNRLKTGNVRAHWHCLRYNEWIFCQPRTFYAGLFKKLKIKDLFFEEGFTKVTGDMAFMYPLLEMARGHCVFIPDVAYVYNEETEISDWKLRRKEQIKAKKFFFAKAPYEPLLDDPREALVEDVNATAPIIVFSTDGPMRLEAFLHSVENFVSPKGEVVIIFESSSTFFDEGYAKVQKAYPNFSYIHVLKNESVTDILIKQMERSKSEYTILAHDRILLKDRIDISEAEKLLKKTGASGFYFQLGANIEPVPKALTPIGSGAFVWKFTHAKESWQEVNNMQMTLYPKKEIIRMANATTPGFIGNFILSWMKGFDTRGIGVCFSESKAIDGDVRIVKNELYSDEELNKHFLNGYVIDIEEFSHQKNRSVAVEYYPRFLRKTKLDLVVNP
jgi:glycosyltransferase involved in cell wall biosynthesis